MENSKENYLKTLSKEELKTICLIWEDGKGIDYETTTEENLIKFILDSVEPIFSN